MSTGDIPLDEGNDKNLVSSDQGNDETSSGKRRSRAYVWAYFERITGEDGLPKTRCTTCNKVYATAANSGTSTMRRHLRKCCPQPLNQFNPTQAVPCANSDEMSEEVRAAKKLKSVMVDKLRSKTDRELVEFIWMNKRNVGILEQKLPEKARAIKEAIKCYEDEIDRRAKLQSPKENGAGPVTSLGTVKVEPDDELAAEYPNVGETRANVNQQKTSPQADSGNMARKQEADQSVNGNEQIAEEERVARLQIVAINRTENQAEEKHALQTAISIRPQDICADLKEVSSALSILTSPDSFYTPQGNPLDQEAENAKQTLIQLLKKDFESIVKSPDEEKVKSCIKILTENLHRLPKCQGRVIEALNIEFESACQNWKTCHTNIQTNIALEVQQGDNLKVLQEWQEKDMEFESKITKVDADILRLKQELREKELTRDNLVKQKSDLFDQSKISIDEAKKLLQDMVTAKLQSDVAIDNMKEVAKKWERNRENFQIKQV
ncbi:uncharacterized protein LOC110926377 isoform X1 [Helianthus annuus]|uniref:uncharacterized protein LOC110926377 isoform X1 n=1 Tax=Helianthus annuus TaxID=4232 RepID=UPI000B8FED1B|nr:uncharacterized protein LOC110926377 isoform X1 [Helianthus annuus]